MIAEIPTHSSSSNLASPTFLLNEFTGGMEGLQEVELSVGSSTTTSLNSKVSKVGSHTFAPLAGLKSGVPGRLGGISPGLPWSQSSPNHVKISTASTSRGRPAELRFGQFSACTALTSNHCHKQD